MSTAFRHLVGPRLCRRPAPHSMGSLRCWAVFFPLLGGVSGLPAAQAQTQIPSQSVLQSVTQPGQGIADAGEPWSVVVNPAGMTQARGWLFGLRHSELSTDTGFSGRGTGLYLSRQLPYLTNFTAGGAIELLRPAISGPVRWHGKLTLALAYRPRSWVSLGLSYAHVFGASTSSPSGIDSVSVGARLTISRFAALGAMLYDLSAPLLSPAAATVPVATPAALIERSYELEALMRPTGDHRFELATGLRFGEASQTLWPRARLWLRPVSGLGISAEGSVLLDPSQLGATPPDAAIASLTRRLDYRVMLGLALDFAHVGADLHALLAGTSGVGPAPRSQPTAGFHGISVGLRVSSEAYRPLWAGPSRMVRIDLGGRSAESMIWLLTRLRRLEHDRRVRAIVVVPAGLRGTWATADELRQALSRLRAAGKRVFAYSGGLSNKDYYVATAAERIFLDPEGSLRLTGLNSDTFYFREALDRLGVRAELVQIGAYKSAPESYTRSEPTDPARKMRQGLIDDQFARLVSAIKGWRGLPADKVEELIEQGPLTAQRALSAKLVDAVATGEQTELAIREIVGEALPLVGLSVENEHATSYAPVGVAIVHMHGDLTGGRSREIPLVGLRSVGAETLVEALDAASQNPQVRAIVLRVNSPGGSATAAEVVARKLFEIAKHKPLVCSLGDIAASGGYWVAAPCSTIFASPSTITGSIGIFGGKVDASGLLDWARVRRLSFQRGSHADQDSPFRPYTDAERTNLREQLQQGYDRFVATVARGRRMSEKEVDERGQGRVFSGQQALAQRLVDQLGGLNDAIAEARRRAGLDPEGRSPLFYYPQRPSSLLIELLSTLPGLLEAAAPAAAGSQPVALFPGRSSQDAPDPMRHLLTTLVGPLVPGLSTALLLLDHSRLARLDPDLALEPNPDGEPRPDW